MTTVADVRMTHAPDTTDSIRALDGSPKRIRVSPYFRWKGLLGRVLAAALLVPGLPIILTLVALVRLTSPGPGIYRQLRVGRHGGTFYMYKIRTMRNDAETQLGPTWTIQNDPRITWLGHWLRKLHLDEFPQLFNVLRGEMTLIGPRPERPEFTQVLAREIPGYLDRLAVWPGITGLAQINLPPDTDLDSVRRKLVLDLEYVQHARPLLDLRMFASTLLRMLGLRGEYAMRVMKLQRFVTIPMLDHGQGGVQQHRTPDSIAPAPVAHEKNGSAPHKGAVKPPHSVGNRLRIK